MGTIADNTKIVINDRRIKSALQTRTRREISATDYDKRFYTHELEEYGRYKNRGIADGVNDEGFYYNAHAASLESYSINEINAPLYHPKK